MHCLRLRNPGYICIDRLDEDWVPDEIRLKLLNALTETIKSFRQVQQVKIFIAIRADLYYSMIGRIVSPGFQEEKIEAYYLPLHWQRHDIETVLDKREEISSVGSTPPKTSPFET
jgi:hypothetical protein